MDEASSTVRQRNITTPSMPTVAVPRPLHASTPVTRIEHSVARLEWRLWLLLLLFAVMDVLLVAIGAGVLYLVERVH